MRKIFTSVLALLPLFAWGQASDFSQMGDSITATYSWISSTKTLTLKGVDMKAGRGMILPDGATIVLEGENKIVCHVGEYDSAIEGLGSLTIKGPGSLSIESSGDESIYVGSTFVIDGCEELNINAVSGEGLCSSGSMTINNSKVSITSHEEEALYPGDTVFVKNNSIITIDAAKDGIDNTEDVYISDSKIYITSAEWACINGNVTAKNSTLVLNALGDEYEYDSCFDASYGETYSFTNCNLTLSAPNGGSIFSPQYESMMTKAAQLNFPEGVTMENTLCRVAEASSNSYYTAVIGAYTLDENLNIEDNLIITEGSTLTIPEGITLENSGTLANAGTIVIEKGGAMNGEENGEIIKGDATGIEVVEGVKAYAQDGTVYVQTPSRMPIAIVSISGATVARAEQEGLHAYSLPKGIYIICIGEQTFKVRN